LAHRAFLVVGHQSARRRTPSFVCRPTFRTRSTHTSRPECCSSCCGIARRDEGERPGDEPLAAALEATLGILGILLVIRLIIRRNGVAWVVFTLALIVVLAFWGFWNVIGNKSALPSEALDG
jgi:hypothetical protein